MVKLSDNKTRRIAELDFLKGVFVTLMVLMHFQLVEDTYPYLRSAVYTFHMSGFLVISGYLANVEKKISAFFTSLLKILIPYIIFEAIYTLAMFYVGPLVNAHNSIETLNIGVLLEHIATMPTGPYWYLHTLAISLIVYFIIYRLVRLSGMTAFIMLSTTLFLLTLIVPSYQWSNVMYFIVGVAVKRFSKDFFVVFRSSWLALFPLIILFSNEHYLQSGSLSGLTITCLVIIFLLWCYTKIGKYLRNLFCYLGRNSLAIVVFSPIFTVVTKALVPFFAFDSFAIVFACVSLPFVMLGCLCCSRLCDLLKISRFLFATPLLYSPMQ